MGAHWQEELGAPVNATSLELGLSLLSSADTPMYMRIERACVRTPCVPVGMLEVRCMQGQNECAGFGKVG